MEYQLKKEQILSSVQYTNLLTFNLVQNKLERNFKSIVEAVMLNQEKTDQLINKTDQLEDKFNKENCKNNQDLHGIKHILKQLQDRIGQIEKSGLPSKNNVEKLPSSNNLTEEKKEENDGNKPETANNIIDYPHIAQLQTTKSLNDKVIDDLKYEISMIKEKLPDVKLIQDQVENMKRQLTALKGELATYGNKSNKSIKRESISNNVNANNIIRRDSLQKPARQSALIHSNSSVALAGNAQNKENVPKEDNVVVQMDVNINDGNYEGDYSKELEGLRLDVNTLNLSYEELKMIVEDLRKRDAKHHAALIEVQDKQKRIQDQMRKDSQNFDKQLKVLQVNALNSGNQKEKSSEKQEKNQVHQKKSPKKVDKVKQGRESRQSSTINFKDQINDKLSKLQNSLQGFVTQTQFNRFKTQTRQKQDQLDKNHKKLSNQFEQQIKKIYDMFISKDIDMNRLKDELDATNQVIKENHAQNQRKHNIVIARIQELKKGLQNLRQDVEFYQSLNAKAEEKKTTQSEKNDSSNKEKAADPKALDDLKRYFNNKMHDQRGYLVGLIRDLEKKHNSANNINQEIANLWDKFNQLGVFLNKKADSEDIKKSINYLEKKINHLGASLMNKDDNTEDARVARTNWYCLSCDKNLMGYQGKVGRHVVWDQMPLKGTLKTTLQRKGLPSINKSK